MSMDVQTLLLNGYPIRAWERTPRYTRLKHLIFRQHNGGASWRVYVADWGGGSWMYYSDAAVAAALLAIEFNPAARQGTTKGD